MNTRWKKYGVKINEIYSLDKEYSTLKKADINAYFQLPKPVQAKKGASIHRQALHLCIDITKTEEDLLKEMSKKTRYKIRRAKRENVQVTYNEHPSVTDIKEFARFYNTFAKEKGIAPCKVNKLIGLKESDMLLLTNAYYGDERKLAANATITNDGLAISLYGASGRFQYEDISGQFISRANGYLHWSGMMYFKRLGYHTYNMMGLTMDENNTEHQKINDYKRSFGGMDQTVYQSFLSQSKLGFLLIWVLKILWRDNPEVMKKSSSKIKCSNKRKNKCKDL